MERGRIARVLERVTHEQGSQLFMVSEQHETTYGEFWESVRWLARSLLSIRIRRGDRIGMWLSNRLEFTLVEMAANLIGAVGVPVSTRYKSNELDYILKHSGIKILFMMDTLANIDFFRVLSDIIPDVRARAPQDLPSEAFPSLEYIVCLSVSDQTLPTVARDFSSFLSGGENGEWENALAEAQEAVGCDELSYIQYTSGSTGLPKGVMYSHEQILTSVTVQGERWELTPEDRMLIMAPFSHGLGHMAGPPMGIRFGASMVPLEVFDAGQALDYIERFRCSTLSAPPTMFQMMLEHPRFPETDLSSLRAALITAAPAPEGLKKEIMDRFGLRGLKSGYGSSETCGGCTQSRLSDPPEVVEETIGLPLRTYEVKVIDSQTGESLPPNTPGELCARGPCIMLGYYGDAEKTSEVIDDDGWFRSGDLAEYDDKGYFKIVGRIKELIITGGNNVYPSEVEAVLEQHPAVKEAQVVSVPDDLRGEVVLAYVVLEEDQTCSQEEIQAFCKERTANYKVPQHVLFVKFFPLSPAGKVLKRELKRRAIKALSLPPT